MFLYYGIVALHILVCIILVLVVLLQSGKGADLAGAFGGGATQTAFGSRGPASFLSKMTTIAAIVFMLTSIGLSMIKTGPKPAGGSILDSTKGAAQPIKAPEAGGSKVKVPTQEQIHKMVEEAEKSEAAKKQQATPAPKPAEAMPPEKSQ
jgi:preprotein translocase subunit SecG